ncbi:MAG: YcfL family protein [Planctomycetes bacterium]|nr:YcfL family protein [Planctomycetota bacterium]
MKLQCLAGALLALAVSACAGQNSVGGTQNVYSGAEGQGELGAVVGNDYLSHALKIQNYRSKRLEDGRLMIQFELFNDTDQNLRFAWAIDWFDAQGFKVADASRHWAPVQLGGGGFTTIQQTGPTPAAENFKLQVTSPNEVR